jgi:hypothetical protein
MQMQLRNAKSKSSKSGSNANGPRDDVSETHLVRDVIHEPPPRNFIISNREVRRFVQNAAVTNQGFTLANGHDQFLVVTQVAGNALPYVDSWRIKYIDVWAVAGSDGTATSVTLTPTGADSSNMNNDPEQLFHITARSFTDPVHMRIKPSKFRPLGAWHFTSNTGFASTLFQMNVNVNSGASLTRVTMDITFETRKNLAGLPLGYGVVTGTTTLGTMGGRPILSGFSLQGVNSLG